MIRALIETIGQDWRITDFKIVDEEYGKKRNIEEWGMNLRSWTMPLIPAKRGSLVAAPPNVGEANTSSTLQATSPEPNSEAAAAAAAAAAPQANNATPVAATQS